MSMRDKEFYQLTISISKAVNPIEAALKVKHARATIIGTFKANGGQAFWAIAVRQPLMENRFTAWKFCHLLHKVLREGHPLCIQHSLRHRKMLVELGKLWGHLTDGYGVCIQNYTKLLNTKLTFHDRNPNFSGNLVLSKSEWDALGGNDINVHFQLAVEMFDYLDDILGLQEKIFTSVNTFHITSMTPAGQCRLAPLIPLIQDSNQLYDLIVRLMFKLHSNLPNDILNGHRERFRVIFKQLKKFYDQARNLQFFVNLITVPTLPENAPNFSSKIDFGSYVPPVVVVPEPDPEPEPIVDNLVDMSSPTLSVASTPEPSRTPAPVPVDLEQLLRERDELIRHLQSEIDRLGKYFKTITISHRDEVTHLEEQISKLNTYLAEAREELTNMRFQKEESELRAQTAPNLEQKAIAEEERAKASEEKFLKLKTMYTQIRDEHVKLLRSHGEATKQITIVKKQASDSVAEKEELQTKLEELEKEQSRSAEVLEKTALAVGKEKELNGQLEGLRREYDDYKIKYEDLNAHKSAEIAELQVKVDDLHKSLNEYQALNAQHTELLTVAANVGKSKEELEEKLEKIQLEKKEIQAEKNEMEKSVINLHNEIKEMAQRIEKMEEDGGLAMENKNNEIDNLKKTLTENEEKFKTTNAILERLKEDRSMIESELHDLLHQQGELEEKHRNALQTIAALESSFQDLKIRGETSIRALLESCIKSAEKLAVRAMSENEFTSAAGTSSYFMMIAEELQEVLNELTIVYGKFVEDSNSVEGLARKTVLAGHLFATVHVQGMTICNTSSDIECGERIAEEIKTFASDVMSLFASLQQYPSSNKVAPKIVDVKEKLTKITTMIHDLSTKSDGSGQIHDLVESELAGMDKAIEAAAAKIAEMLSISRKSDSGLKLEVNEKILDACTNLMQAIRILVQKSRLLQAEIISLGKGTASAKEFYKRNHQWTEGLISSAKSVATGANLLVTAANKAVTGESKHHLDIIVAAQEIAACTAQLVVASRVKAQRESKNLAALSNASRDVTQATGAVVATAKDCTQQFEDSQDLDLTKLTVHQAKTLEMEIQVKVLELEQALQMERLRLAAFRRKNYQNSEEK